MTKSKKPASKSKKTTPAVTTPAPVEVSPAQETPEKNLETSSDLNDSFSELLAQLSTLRGQLTAVTGNVRALQKRADKEMKAARKNSKKRKNKNLNRQPSGFVKPTKISPELAAFLKKPPGTEMARTEVTREINGYIREHNLQDPSNGRKIIPDGKLKKLLKLQKNDELTYFNLQKYMSPHFAKKGDTAFESS
jgi:upstream activation factor subunit UAF30